MTIGSTMWNSCDAALLALTARERWAAAQDIGPHSGGDYLVIAVAILLLLALVVLLWWVSHRRPRVPALPAKDLFSDGAARRGLGTRERQILLAIVARSGLRRNYDIFITPDAFDQGGARLLEECARSRTAQETEKLRAEMAMLRTRLGYRVKGKGGQFHPPSSRDVSVGAAVELLRRSVPGAPSVEAVVIRSDNLGITVETATVLGSPAGESWRVRYRLDGVAWQFDTSTVSCEDRRLVLHHGEQVRAAEHDRLGRVAVHVPATVARFPLMQAVAMESEDSAAMDWFEQVRGVVIEASESGLQVRCSLSVQVNERVLVLFTLGPVEVGVGANDASRRGHVIGHVGRVTHKQAAGEETVITVDLTNLTDREIDELMRLARAAAHNAQVMQGA
jgi:hypothetical protein